MDTEELRAEYDLARTYTAALYDDLDEAEIRWRASENASGIGWHLGHQATVNHFLLRNLVAAEASPDAALDALFDSATQEPLRGELPPMRRITAFRDAVAQRTHTRVDQVLSGAVGAPQQLRLVIDTLLVSLINHEYQHDTWIREVRESIGRPRAERPQSVNLAEVDGYWVLAPDRPRVPAP
jgi:hypothetical protein